MRKWLVTIEDCQGEGLEYTYHVYADNIVEAATEAAQRCEDNYEDMVVIKVDTAWGD